MSDSESASEHSFDESGDWAQDSPRMSDFNGAAQVPPGEKVSSDFNVEEFAQMYQEEASKASNSVKGKALGNAKYGKDLVGNQVHKVTDGVKAGRDKAMNSVGELHHLNEGQPDRGGRAIDDVYMYEIVIKYFYPLSNTSTFPRIVEQP